MSLTGPMIRLVVRSRVIKQSQKHLRQRQLRKRKKLMRRLVWLGIGAAVVLVAVLVLLFLKGR